MTKLLSALVITALMCIGDVVLAIDYKDHPDATRIPRLTMAKSDPLPMKAKPNQWAVKNRQMHTSTIDAVSESVIWNAKLMTMHEAVLAQMKKTLNGTSGVLSIDAICGN